MSIPKICSKQSKHSSIFRNQNDQPRKVSIFCLNTQLQQIKKISNTETLNNKLKVSAKLQKDQKQAIKYFYQNQVSECFTILDNCLLTLKAQSLPDHELYVNYLYVQFLVKLHDYENALKYIAKSYNTIHKLKKEQKQKMENYIISIEALNIFIHSEKKQYDKVLSFVNQTKQHYDYTKWTDKTRRLINISQIQALINYKKYEEAIDIINMSLNKLETQYQQIYYMVKKIQCLVQLPNKVHKNEGMRLCCLVVEYLQNSKQNEIGNRKQSSDLLDKLYGLLCILLKEEPVKLIYYFEKLINLVECEKKKNQILKKLFSLYYQLSDFQEAIRYFQQINKEINDPQLTNIYQNCAQIQIIYGQQQQAHLLLNEVMKHCSSDIHYCQLAMTILQNIKLNDEQSKSLQKSLQKMLKQLSEGENTRFEKVKIRYSRFLKLKGQNEKCKVLFNSSINKNVEGFKISNKQKVLQQSNLRISYLY